MLSFIYGCFLILIILFSNLLIIILIILIIIKIIIIQIVTFIIKNSKTNKSTKGNPRVGTMCCSQTQQ
jgi:heme/copper-type cytochrome/quinol oxidase subunit 2